jgi:hypothetical protein
VAPKEVVVVKESRSIAEEFDALLGTLLHLAHMGEAMQGPQILRLQGKRRARTTLGHCIVANLFHRKGMGRKKMPITRGLGTPMASDFGAHFGLMSLVTGPEKRTSVLTQGQQVQRPLDEDLFPGRRASGKILRDPGAQCFLMQTLPPIRR